MDPNNTQPQGDNVNLGKLEQDLANLSKEAPAQVPVSATATPGPTPSVLTPPSLTPEVPGAQSAVMPEVTPPAPDSNPPVQKKTSPVLVVALVLMVIAILAAIAYVVGTRFFTPQETPLPEATVEVVPTETPLETTIESPSPSVLPTASSSAKATATPKATATATPLATP